MKQALAIIDPLTTVSLPPMVTASTGLDVLNHAIESFTSHPYTVGAKLNSPGEVPFIPEQPRLETFLPEKPSAGSTNT